MDPSKLNLKVGDILRVQVVEKLSQGVLIVSYNGALLRVANQTAQSFALGQIIAAQVHQVQPLGLRLFLNSNRYETIV